MRSALLLLLLLLFLWVSVAFPLVTGYHVEPVKAAWSGWAPSEFPNNFVSQGVTCNFDSLSYVELFAGEKGDSGTYTATVYDDGVRLMRSNGLEFRGHNTQLPLTVLDQRRSATLGAESQASS